jgi:predicted PurR-regulated permease PerM
MDVLKKIRSSTLLESLIATVLIVVVFIVSSLTINNLLHNSFNNNTLRIENRLDELEYDLQNGKLNLPYTENFEDWTISITSKTEALNRGLEILANKNSGVKTITRKRIE